MVRPSASSWGTENSNMWPAWGWVLMNGVNPFLFSNALQRSQDLKAHVCELTWWAAISTHQQCMLSFGCWSDELKLCEEISERRGCLAIEICLELTWRCVFQTKVTLSNNKTVMWRNIWCEIWEKGFQLRLWEVCPHIRTLKKEENKKCWIVRF